LGPSTSALPEHHYLGSEPEPEHHLCIPDDRAIDASDVPAEARLVRFRRSVPIDAVLAIIDAACPPGRASGNERAAAP
jgi:hypothetical protein